MNIDKSFQEFLKEQTENCCTDCKCDPCECGTVGEDWPDGHEPQGIDDQYIEEVINFEEKRKVAKDVGLECQECGKRFRHKNPKYGITKCPKCKSTDLDLAYGEESELDEMPNRANMEKVNSLLKKYSGKFKWRDEVLYVEKGIEKDVTNRMKIAGLTAIIKVSSNPMREEIELDEMKWEAGVVYHQEFKNGDKVYFRADSVQKNKRWKGLSVDEFGGRQKKAKNASADEKSQGWVTTPKNEIPKGLKEEVELDELGGYGGSRHKKIERDKYNKGRRGQGIKDDVEVEEGTWALPNSQTDYDNLMKIMKKPIPAGKAAKLLYGITGDDVLFDAIGKVEDNNKNADVRSLVKDFLKQPNVKKHMKKHGIKEEVELEEVFNVGKMSDAKLKAFIGQFDPDERMGMAAAMQLKAAKKEARKRGIKEDDEIDEKVKPAKDVGLECMECGHKFRHKNPKYGITKCPKCKSTDLDLQFGEEVKVDEVKSDYEDAIAAFKAKGGNVKKLKPGKKFKSLFKQKGPKKLPRQAEEVEVDEDAKMGKQTDDNLRKIYKKALAADQSSPANEFMTKRIAKEMKKRGIKEKVEISEGRPKIVDPTAPRPGDKEKQLRVAAQNKKYKPEEVANIARKHKVRMDGEPVPGERPNDLLIAVRGGIILDYDYKNNMTYIKGWKVDRKKIRTHITKYEQGGSSYEDLIGVGRVLGVRGFESAFELIGEELQLTEGKKKTEEESPANNIGSGNVNIDPHLKKKKKVKTEEFSGNKVFVVSAQRFHDSRLGKARYARYEKYVGNDEVGEAIRLYGRSNPKLPIILKNSENGAMLYLKYGSKR